MQGQLGPGGCRGDDGGAVAIDLEREVRFALGLVDCGIGRGIDDGRRSMPRDGALDGRGVADVSLGVSQCHDVPPKLRASFAQVPADLAAGPEHHDLGHGRPRFSLSRRRQAERPGP